MKIGQPNFARIRTEIQAKQFQVPEYILFSWKMFNKILEFDAFYEGYSTFLGKQ